ncbi:Eukaryotic-type DNA primase, large subunit [Ostertagia ostertagi]
MYTIPPSEEIGIEEFDDIAIKRLKALRSELKKYLPIASGSCPPADVEKARREDVIGHFILRLAFCRSPESTKWLVTQEVDLFRFRFASESPNGIIAFLKENNVNLDVVENSEKEELMAELAAGCGISIEQACNTNFWKVDFTAAPDLVRRRPCARSSSDLVVITSAALRANMTAAMARAFKHLAVVEEEWRLLPRLARLANNAYSGKQQYGLFLKAIGLSLEEAIMFMREEFTKKIDSDKFEKQYAYNIRHMYGKEGRRVEYPAFPSAGEGWHWNREQINQIVNYSKMEIHFDQSCHSSTLTTDKNDPKVLSGARSKTNHLHQSHSTQQPEQMPKKEENFSDSEN